MGDERVNDAVTDAGPVIHLFEIDCLSFLRIFDTLHVPDAVWMETVGRARVQEADILHLGNVKRHTLAQTETDQFVQDHQLEELHAGEKESLYLSKLLNVSLLLTDDLAVRKAAKRLELRPVGSLGVVVRAYREGKISLEDAEQHLIDLYETSTLFVTRAIVELAIEQLRDDSN